MEIILNSKNNFILSMYTVLVMNSVFISNTMY